MAWLSNLSAARDFGARALFRGRRLVPSPEFIERTARCYIAVAIAAYIVDLLRQTRDHLTDGVRRPFGDDFVNFWSGPFLAWHHRAAEIYNFDAFHAFEQSIVGAHIQGYNYSYPPVLLVATAPLALIPYLPGFALWLSAGWFAFYRALRLNMPDGRVLLFALATPAVFINSVAAQTGTWTAALFGGGLGLLDRRPILGGGLLGLLICKPQLGILVPIALVAGRRWRALTAAAVAAGFLIAVSVISFGPDIYGAFLQRLALIRHFSLEDGTGVWHRSLSVFVAARRLGADVPVAYLIQAVATTLAAAAVAAMWFRNVSAGIRNAMLVLGTYLATPYLQDYDLVSGALVVVWLGQNAEFRGARDVPLFYAKASLLLIPFFAAALAQVTGLAFGPLFILPAFIIALKYGLAETSSAAPARAG